MENEKSRHRFWTVPRLGDPLNLTLHRLVPWLLAVELGVIFIVLGFMPTDVSPQSEVLGICVFVVPACLLPIAWRAHECGQEPRVATFAFLATNLSILLLTLLVILLQWWNIAEAERRLKAFGQPMIQTPSR